jgi:hypothetical protein
MEREAQMQCRHRIAVQGRSVPETSLIAGAFQLRLERPASHDQRK